MVLIGLLKGGDYHPGGLESCGAITAHGLAKCGFGDTLCHAAENLDKESLITFLISWRNDVRHELLTDSQGHIGQKNPKLANNIPDSFPNIDILFSYTKPLTSEFTGGNAQQFTWETEPDLRKLAALCETHFEWGYEAAIVEKFRTVIWCSIVLRILRRAAIQLDSCISQGQFKGLGASTSLTNQHFSSIYTGTTTELNLNSRFFVKIHSARRHISTDNVLEYELEILPIQLIHITKSGIHGTRRIPSRTNIMINTSGESDKEKKGKGKIAPAPESPFMAWMPACMVQMVEPGLVAEYEAQVGSDQPTTVSSSSGHSARRGPPGIEGSIAAIFPRDRKQLHGVTPMRFASGDDNNDHSSVIDDSPPNAVRRPSPSIFRPSRTPTYLHTQAEIIVISSDSESDYSDRLGKGKKRKGHPSGSIRYKFPKIRNIVKDVIDLT